MPYMYNVGYTSKYWCINLSFLETVLIWLTTFVGKQCYLLHVYHYQDKETCVFWTWWHVYVLFMFDIHARIRPAVYASSKSSDWWQDEKYWTEVLLHSEFQFVWKQNPVRRRASRDFQCVANKKDVHDECALDAELLTREMCMWKWMVGCSVMYGQASSSTKNVGLHISRRQHPSCTLYPLNGSCLLVCKNW